MTTNEMTIGFYQELRDLRAEYPEADFAFMENIEYNPYQFLHGYCDQFAMVLSQKFGYEIELVRNDDSLIHAYCTVNFQGKKAYIDVRGITTVKRLFFDEFADWLTMEKDGSLWADDEGYMYEIFPDHFENWNDYSADLGEYPDKSLLDAAELIIADNPSYYQIKQ